MQIHRNTEFLWKAMQKGDKKAFEKMHEMYFDELFSFGKKLSSDHIITDECIQRLFVNLWEKKDRLAIPQNIKAYLLVSLRRLILKELERIKKTDSIEKIQTSEQPFSRNVPRHDLKSAIQRLSRREQEILHLRYFQNVKNPEISEIMEISYQSTANLLQRAIKNLRANLVLEKKI